MPPLKAFVANSMRQTEASNYTRIDLPSVSQTMWYDVSSSKNKPESLVS